MLLSGICGADLDNDGIVGVGDLVAVLSRWGVCAAPCPQDLNDDGSVDFNDLLIVLSRWGVCE